MLEWIPLPGWVIRLDREATKASNEKLPLPWPSCTCLYCRNFIAAGHLLPDEFVQFSLNAGLDPMKPIEVVELTAGEHEGTRLYMGWYHLVGEIVSSPKDDASPLPDSQPVGGFDVSFTDKLDLVQDGFPRPAIQLHFFGDIPWVMDEKPDI